MSDVAIVEEEAVVVDEEVRELFGLCDDVHYIERLKNNDPERDRLLLEPDDAAKLEERAWERLGSYIAGNDHLQKLDLDECGLGDSKMAALFKGLTKSGPLRTVLLGNNGYGLSGIRSMIPFLQSSPNLTRLAFNGNESINTECFDLVLQTLDGVGGIETLSFCECTIDSLAEMGRINLPKLRQLYLARSSITDIPVQALANYTHLERLTMSQNNIGESGFHAIATLLRKEDCSLQYLYVGSTGMGADGAKIIAESLRCNKKLEFLGVDGNKFGPEGLLAFLKVLNDVSSMDRTGNSNHTLIHLNFDKEEKVGDSGERVKEIAKHLDNAFTINWDHHKYPDSSGRAKVLKTLLVRTKRMALSRMQGIVHSSDHYLFSGIDPILLPNVLELVVATGSQSELYQMLLVVAPDLVSLIDREAMLKDTMASNEARLAAIAAEQAMLTAANSRLKKQLSSIQADGDGAASNNLSGNKRGRDSTAEEV